MHLPAVVGIVLAFGGVFFPIESPRVTLPFGALFAPYYTRDLPHSGVDLVPMPGPAHGRAVFAPIDGTIYIVGYSHTAGWFIVLASQAPHTFWATARNGDVHTVLQGQPIYFRFAHLSQVYVVRGGRVQAGQTIAAIGNTGASTTAPHLHLSLRLHPYERWFTLDPIDFFIASIPGLREYLQATSSRYYPLLGDPP